MNRLFKKAFNDLRGRPARSVLVIIALIVGMWGIGSIAVSYTVLKNDLSENYLKTSPGHVILVSQSFNKLDLDQFRQRPEIASAEFRDFSIERVEVHKDQWLPFWLFGVEDFDRFQLARFYSEQGQFPPPPGTLLIERNGQLISDLDIGSIVRLQTANKQIQQVPVTGIAFDPAQAPSSMDYWIYGYVDKQTFHNLTGIKNNQRLVVRFNGVYSTQEVRVMTQHLLEDFSAMGIETTKVTLPKFNEHPHQFQLNSLLFLQGGIGMLAFVMGMILVSQVMSAILAQQVRQIGILKAIGASSLQVFNSYLVIAAILGLIAMTLSIPLAIISGYGFTQFVAQQLNFEVLTPRLPAQYYFLLFSIGLLLPILASVNVIRRGVMVSVVDALSDYGVTIQNESKKLMQLPFSSTTMLAVRNTLRRKRRVMITVATLALGVAIFSTGFNLRQSLVNMLDDIGHSLQYDVRVVLNTPLPESQVFNQFQGVDNVKQIQNWSGAKGIIQTNQVGMSSDTTIVALPYDTNVIDFEMLAGRWLQSSEALEIVVNQSVLESFDEAVIGEHYQLSIQGKLHTVKLVGIAREFALPTIYMDKAQYEQQIDPQGLAKTVLFVANENSAEEVAALKKNIERTVENAAIKVRYVTSHSEWAKILYDHLDIILSLLSFLALLVLIVGALGMASATSINIVERTREIGVLKAIGATPAMVRQLFVNEGMIVIVASILIGLLVALPLSVLLANFFGDLILQVPLNFAFSYPGLLITLITCLLFGWLASRIPAERAINVSVREALAYE